MSLAAYHIQVQDDAGNVVPGAHVEIRREVSGSPLAVPYDDRDGTVGTGNPFDVDSNGRKTVYLFGGAHRVRIYTGASGAPTTELILRHVAVGLNAEGDGIGVKTQLAITSSGTVVLDASDADQININKTVAAATRVVLPLAALRSRSIRIVDRKYDAATNNITIVPKRPSTVTISIASPGVVTLSGHGQAANDPVSLETTGALPTGLAADTQYYVKTVLSPSTFTLSQTPGGAVINTSGVQSGVHSVGFDTIMGSASYTIDSSGAAIELVPLSDGSGWA